MELANQTYRFVHLLNNNCKIASQVQGNETVKLHYTGKLNDGLVVRQFHTTRAIRGKTR